MSRKKKERRRSLRFGGMGLCCLFFGIGVGLLFDHLLSGPGALDEGLEEKAIQSWASVLDLRSRFPRLFLVDSRLLVPSDVTEASVSGPELLKACGDDESCQVIRPWSGRRLDLFRIASAVDTAFETPESAERWALPAMRLVQDLQKAGARSAVGVASFIEDDVLDAIDQGWIPRSQVEQLSAYRTSPSDIQEIVLADILEDDQLVGTNFLGPDDAEEFLERLCRYRIYWSSALEKICSLGEDRTGIANYLLREKEQEEGWMKQSVRQDSYYQMVQPSVDMVGRYYERYTTMLKRESRWQALLHESSQSVEKGTSSSE